MFFNHSNSQSHSQGFSDNRTSGGPPANKQEVTNDKKIRTLMLLIIMILITMIMTIKKTY